MMFDRPGKGKPYFKIHIIMNIFDNFYRTHVYMGSNLWVLVSLTNQAFADLTDVTLADEDTNSILTDDANRTIPGNMAMQVPPPGGKIQN